MDMKTIAIIGGIALLVIIVMTVLVTLTFTRALFFPFLPNVASSPTPAPTILTPTPVSPTVITPSATQSFTGRIIGISSQPIAFKNAVVVTIQSSTTQTPLYVSSETIITNVTNQTISRNQLQVGMNVSAIGTPTEGGIDVSNMTVQ